jgi:dienelactone hydrolase
MSRRPSTRLPILAALLALAACAPAATAARRVPDLANDRCVLTLPGMDEVKVREGLVYAQTDSATLAFDLYLPPKPMAQPPPVVVFVNGVGDRPGIGMRTWGIYRSWGRLAAARGMAAVVHDTRLGHLDEDPRAFLAHLRKEGKALGVDGENVLLWFCSANTGPGWRMAQDPAHDQVKGAVLYYGFPDTLLRRVDLPVLIGRAGLDLAAMNSAIDGLFARALRANAPYTLINVANGHHAFDAFDHNEASRAAVAATLDWMVEQANPVVRAAQAEYAEELQARRHTVARDWPAAEAAARAWIAADPADPVAQSILAQALYGQQRWAEAGAAYRAAGDAGVQPAFNWYNAACCAALGGDKEQAIELLTKAVGTGMFQDRSAIRRDTDLELLVGDPRFEALAGPAPPSSASSN